MVEIIEVKGWTGLSGAFIVDVRSLEDLKKLAEGLELPFILQRKNEYLLIYGPIGKIPLCYRFKG